MALNIDPRTWATLSRLLDEALELSEEARQRWLESLDPAHDTLKPHLVDLLARKGAVETADLLQTLPKFGASVDHAQGHTGAVVGGYRLLRELGSGGMGSVWLAERVDGLVNRPVALKLPHTSGLHAGIQERMALEREFLAALNHPNIATLYDAGVLPDGQPFLALEYVSGQPIDEYCRVKMLDLPARLELFLQVADAVAHAHARLIVHRDLKPSNILVTEEGVVRLLDFGIAKLLDGGRRSKLTEYSGRALTPDYAAPEQILGRPVSTATDVYSLGVVLYELLTGVRPYQLKRDSRGALEDAIVELDPRPPSAAADGSNSRALRGDLDVIVLKALKKNPDERYGTVQAFAEDIGRYRRNEPVLARPDSGWYRMRKFLRRNRVPAAAASLVAVALTAGVSVTAWQMVEARRQRDIAVAEGLKSERVSQLLEDVLASAAPENSSGRPVTVLELIDRATPTLRERTGDDAVIRARMLRTTGYAYHRLGEPGRGRPLVEEAIDLARGAGAEGKRELAGALLVLGQIQRHADQATQAAASYREALEIQRQLGDEIQIGKIQNELAILLRAQDPEESLRIYRDLHAKAVERFGADSAQSGELLGNVGAQLTRMRRYGEANGVLQKAITIVGRQHGTANPRYATLLNNLAITEKEQGNFERAMELQLMDNAIATRALGPDHYDVGMSWLNVARTSLRMGQYEKALEQVDRSLGILRKHFPDHHAVVVTAMNTRGQLLQRLGRLDQARVQFDLALTQPTSSADGIMTRWVVQLSRGELDLHTNNLVAAQVRAEEVLAAPAAEKDLSLIARAQQLKMCVLGRLGDLAGAQSIFGKLIETQRRDPQSRPYSSKISELRYSVCTGDTRRAAAIAAELDQGGYRDRWVLDDPVFAVSPGAP